MSEFDLKDFRTDVVEESKIRPVVIDFWAAWCGPCRVLGPIIEKLAREAKGKWRLVKIDTEAYPELAAQFQIRGIPAVKMVYQGKLIAEFSGALPEAQIRKWLEQYLPKNEQEEAGIENVHALLAQGHREQALDLVKDLFIDFPENDEYRLTLAMLLLPNTIDEAEQVLEPFKKNGKFPFEVEAVQTLKSAKAILNGDEKLPDGGNPKAVESLLNGLQALFAGDFATAMDQLIQSIMYDKSFSDELARKCTVALFKLLTDHHPLAKAKRRAFSMALS